ncbi:MAG: metal ABC transporter permease [Candidatus Calescibacterium sp.]|nr:metal ABC transporter permease [Candidatus Calescibacterium sp.]MCX7734364.1 metal ABC transporter permease [bacterium]MDW8086872.1 metal ABC transporter permease [Candidatus Calescibacterium sp.]
MIDIIIPSFILSLSLVLIHVYFGLRIFERGIIFSDIAIAQVSALGIAFSSLFGLEKLSYIFGVGFSAIAGLLLSAMRKYSVELKESFVGILYAFSSALGILIFSKMPEHEIQGIKEMIMGNILFVDTEDVLKGTIVYVSVGVVHLLLRRKIKNGSFFWEFFFYLTFGFVVSSSVSMGGVLLVFSYLVIPTFCSNLILKDFRSKLIFGWILGIVSNLIGFVISIKLDYPTGVSVIVVLGAISFIFLLFSKLR